MKHAIFLLLSLALATAFTSCGSVTKMKEAKEAKRPVLSSISPTSVKQGWTGTMKIVGGHFDINSYAFFDYGSNIPVRHIKSDTLMDVDVTTDVTRLPHTWKVVIHNNDGSESDELSFVVIADPSYVPPPIKVKTRKGGSKSGKHH